MEFIGPDKEFHHISAKELVDILIADSLKDSVKRYGIEGLEERIIDLYSQMPDCRDRMLEVYRKMYKYGK
jgi:hypothetical protein